MMTWMFVLNKMCVSVEFVCSDRFGDQGLVNEEAHCFIPFPSRGYSGGR